MRYALLFAFTLLSFTLIARAGDDSMSGCPMHTSHDSEFQQMNERGDSVMGFSQEKAAHHFTLTEKGGRINVQAKDETDSETIGKIQMHLQHIAHSFAAGDFQMPHEIHQQTPPGVPEMQQRKDKIRYKFQKEESGASVEIESDDEDAVNAIHDFLRFQIQEHHTGDRDQV